MAMTTILRKGSILVFCIKGAGDRGHDASEAIVNVPASYAQHREWCILFLVESPSLLVWRMLYTPLAFSTTRSTTPRGLTSFFFFPPSDFFATRALIPLFNTNVHENASFLLLCWIPVYLCTHELRLCLGRY